MSDSLAIVRRRWPAVAAWMDAAPEVAFELVDSTPVPTLCVRGVHLTSAYDRAAEARLQAGLVPGDATRATVYGLALGDLPRALLSRANLRALRVVVLAPAVARLALAHFDQTDWLEDERVELVLAAGEGELRAPFAAAPAALELAEEDAARLRDLVVLELATPHIRAWLAANEGRVREHTAANRERLAVDGDVAELFGAWAGRTVHVAAAGPTLGDHFAELAAADAPLVAVDAALRPLLARGVRPDVVVALDSSPKGVVPHFEGDLTGLEGAALVYLPEVAPAALEHWPGRRLASYTLHPRYAELAREHPRGRLWSSGTVFHAAVDLAVRAGAARVVLYGADFGYPREASHAAGSAHSGEVRWTGGAWVKNGRGERIPSLPNLVGYLRDFERYVARCSDVLFENAGRDGAAIEGVEPRAEVAP